MLASSNKMSKIKFVIVIGLMLFFTLISCSSNDTTNSSLNSCEEAMKTAAEVSDMQDMAEDIDPAIRVCGSMQEFTSASSKFPEALDGVDEATFVTNRCTYNASLQNTAICKSIVE